MPQELHEGEHPKLKKTLGMGSVTLLGIGALMGGGIFTILGTSIGLAGGAGMLAAVALLGAVMVGIVLIYAELGTTFPEAGGGYLWIREGLSDLQGFLSGWISWFAHAAAAGLYALSFGFYVSLILELLPIEFPVSPHSVRTIAAVLILIVFGFVNWRGVGTISKAANFITIAVLAILSLFILSGIRSITSDVPQFVERLDFSFPAGLVGIFAAMSFFFIAFEGSEIQTQAAEEMRSPSRDLPRALFATHAAVIIIYLLVTAALVAGLPLAQGQGVLQASGTVGEHALAYAAANILPFGSLIIIIGGLLVNIAALNATIFSSSHVALAMARSRHILRDLAAIHVRNQTPHRAVVISTIAIIALAIFFPLREIASITSLLFILLFLQTTFAFLALRRHRPDAPRTFRAPWTPWLPLATALLLALLGVLLITHVSPLAGIVVGAWLLFGLVNYFAYSQPMENEEIESATVFEKTWRVGGDTRWRLLLPLTSTEHGDDITSLAFALAKHHEAGGITILRVDETPGDHRARLEPGRKEHDHESDERFLEHLVALGAQHAMNTRALILESTDPVRAILGYIRLHHVNLAVLGWDGLGRRGQIFTRKVDSILREARCDLVVVKLKDLENLKRIFIALPPDGGPHLRYVGRIALALAEAYGGTVTVSTVLPPHTSEAKVQRVRELLWHAAARMRLPQDTLIEIIRNSSRVQGIIGIEDKYDVILLGAARERFLKEIRVGRVPEAVAQRSKKTVIIVKGHQGILPSFVDYIRERI